MIERCPVPQNGYYDVAASGVQTLQKRRKASHQVVVALGSLTESSLCGNLTSRWRLKTFVSECRVKAGYHAGIPKTQAGLTDMTQVLSRYRDIAGERCLASFTGLLRKHFILESCKGFGWL